MHMKILLVEDEVDIQRFLKQSLAEAAYEVDAAGDAATAMRLAAGNAHDILIVDLGLPDQEGIDLILSLRSVGVNAPVLILSARRSVDDRVRGLEQGGDDYLTKPFALAELLARVRNLIRRKSTLGEECVLCVADLELDLLQKEAKRRGKAIDLSPNEFTLLECLCRNAGRVVTRSMLLERVWGIQSEPKTNNLDVHINRLRAKVDGSNRPSLIETLRGKGFLLKTT
jgi:DNA-binding response OmpR family regulator